MDGPKQNVRTHQVPKESYTKQQVADLTRWSGVNNDARFNQIWSELLRTVRKQQSAVHLI